MKMMISDDMDNCLWSVAINTSCISIKCRMCPLNNSIFVTKSKSNFIGGPIDGPFSSIHACQLEF